MVKVSEARIVTYCDFCPPSSRNAAGPKCHFCGSDICAAHRISISIPEEPELEPSDKGDHRSFEYMTRWRDYDLFRSIDAQRIEVCPACATRPLGELVKRVVEEFSEKTKQRDRKTA